MLQLDPQRSESPTLRSEWRRASQTPKAGRCTFLGGRRTWHVFLNFFVEKFLTGHIRTVPENIHVKFEVRSFNRFKLV